MCFDAKETDSEEKEIQCGFQAEGGGGGHARGQDGARDRGAARPEPEPGWEMEVGGHVGASGSVSARWCGEAGPGIRRSRSRRCTRGSARDKWNGLFSQGFGALARAERLRMVCEDTGLSLSRACELAGVSRASVYCRPVPADSQTPVL